MKDKKLDAEKLKTKKSRKLSVQEFDLVIAKTLRWGVFVVGCLLLLGMFASFLLNAQGLSDIFANYKVYQSESLQSQLNYAWLTGNWGILITYLGVAGLIFLPILRVLMVMILFTKTKEYWLCLICFLVLSGLSLSFYIGAVKSI